MFEVLVLRKLLFLTLVVGFLGCSDQNNQLPPNPPGWILELRQGFTNLDDSFLLSGASTGKTVQALKAQQLQTQLDKYGLVGLIPQTSVGFAINLYVSIKHDNVPPTADLSLSMVSPNNSAQMNLAYAAGDQWAVYYPIPTLGQGTYQVTTPVDGKSLHGTFSVAPPSSLFPLSSITKLGVTDSELAARWTSVEGAKSYIALIYDYGLKKYVATQQTTQTSVHFKGLTINKGQTYGLVLLSFSWDTSLSTKQVFPDPLPTAFNASVVERKFTLEDPDISNPAPNPVGIYGQPGEKLKATVSIANESTGFGLLKYSANLTGSSNVRVTSGAADLVFSGDSASVELEGTCPASETQETASLSIQSNDPDEKTKNLPIQLECLFPTRATLALSKQGQSDIQTAAWSGDGTKIATAGNGGIYVWSAVDGTLLRTLDGEKDIAFSPDNQSLLGIFGNVAKVWSVSSGSELRQLGPMNGFSSGIRNVAWSPDGTKIALATSDQVGIFSTTGSPLLQFTAWDSSMSIGDLQWSLDSTKLATTSNDAVIWNASTGKEVLRIANVQGPIAWNSDGTQLAGGRLSDNSLRIWNASTGTLIRVVGTTPNWPSNLVWKGDRIAAFTSDSNSVVRVDLYTASTGVLQRSIAVGGFLSDTPLALSPDGKQLVTAQAGDSPKIWNADTGAFQLTLGFPAKFVTGLSFSPDGSSLLTSLSRNNGGSLVWLALSSGSIAGTIERSVGVNQGTVTWVPNSNRIAAVGPPDASNLSSLKAYQWDTSTKTLVSSFDLPGQAQTAWNLTATKLAVGTFGGTFQIYNVGTGTSTVTLTGSSHDDYLQPSWSLDGSKVAAPLPNQGNFIWDASTGNQLQKFQNGAAGTLSWSPDGNKLLGIANGRIFSATTGSILLASDELTGQASWRPDNRRIAISKYPNTAIEIFSAFSGRKLLTIPNSNLGTSNTPLNWSADGKYLAAGGDSRLLVWNITSVP